MRMNVKAPVAPCGGSAKAVPRGAALTGLRQSAFLLGSSGHCLRYSARAAAPGRGTRLIIKAEKKHVYHLERDCLYGETVLASNLFF